MKHNRFIWLDPAIYPEKGEFCIAEFKKEIEVEQELDIEICALARYLLYVNGELVGRGPCSVGGDFLDGEHTEPYYDKHIVNKTGKLEIKALVTSVPTVLTEYDFGASGLWISISSMGKKVCETDESWDVRQLAERKHILYSDYTEIELPFHKAKYIPKKFNCILTPIEKLSEEKIFPCNFEKIQVEGGKSAKECLLFDKIYSAYPHIVINCQGKCTVNIISSEQGEGGICTETVVTDKYVHHLSPRMRSIGQIELEIINESSYPVIVEQVYIDYVHYPVYTEGTFKCSDNFLNKLYEVCMHTLKICRQTIHLDSPTHQEHLACTGDYFIQSMIEYMSLYDPTLAEWDIKRTSRQLKIQKGRLFHTTYSLIYPWWVLEHYRHTNDTSVIDLEAIKLLLDLFDTYVSKENGLVEYAPDYMFVDWVVASEESDTFLDGGTMMSHGKMTGYSLHHPPKALGQSVLCMFYYNALLKVSKLYEIVNDQKSAKECLKKAEKIKESINSQLFDSTRGLYVGGLNTPNLVKENAWLPENTSVVYYLKQANVLAVLFGIAPTEKRRSILEYVLKDLNKYEMQPYFYHFLLNALYRENMFGEYGFELIGKYESLINKCDKGLSEAWENMKCDYSHAWGATPAYMLKKALSGIEILEPAYKKIKLTPRLYNLEFAEYEITTPYGKIEICHKKGDDVSVIAPKEIEIVK